MSRHIIKDNGLVQVVVGWDRPLQGFFVDMYDLTDGEEEDLLYTAGVIEPPIHITSVAKLNQLAQEHTRTPIPAEVQEILMLEQAGLRETNVVRDWTRV